eukprot:SAG22_NODE_5780_length_953_cov_1.402810_3_plen_91_part_01
MLYVAMLLLFQLVLAAGCPFQPWAHSVRAFSLIRSIDDSMALTRGWIVLTRALSCERRRGRGNAARVRSRLAGCVRGAGGRRRADGDGLAL